MNTAVGFAVIVMTREALGLSDIASNASGYAVGLLVGFAINRALTFRHTGTVMPAFLRFLLVFAVAYAANLAVVGATIGLWGRWPYLPHLAGLVIYTALFYAGSRFFTFRR